MTIPIILVLVAFTALSDAVIEPSCKQTRPFHCFAEDVGELNFPKSEEALNKLCLIMQPRLKCLIDFKNKCGLPYPEPFVGKLETVYDVMVETCNKESTLHKEISKNLPCLEDVMTSHRNACEPMVKEALEEIMNELNIERDEEDEFANEEDGIKYYCLMAALDTTCFVATSAVKCGNEAGELVGELIDRTELLDVSCPENIRNVVKEAVEIVHLQMMLKLATDQLISKV